MKILVMEDDPMIREEVIDWLTFEGYETVSAENGQEGIALALNTMPDLILSDITMPELDGYGVLLELQKHPQLMAIPFIFLSARADKSFVRHGMELGADDYVTKPFTRAELLSAINARLARHQAVATTIYQEVNDLKVRIARMVSHELKTPLVPLTLVLQIAERQLGRLSESEIASLLQTLRFGTDRLQHIVEQIVYLTQIESGLLTPESIRDSGTEVSIWQVMPRAIDLARRYAYRNREGQITLDQRDPKATIWGNALMLKHVFVELLINALNFSSEGSVIAVSQWHSEGQVWISILDQGIGMSSEEVTQAQIAFEQINRETKEQQGLGIGLTVVQRIIQTHGGTLQVGSVPGKGTQVTLSLPMFVPAHELSRRAVQ